MKMILRKQQRSGLLLLVLSIVLLNTKTILAADAGSPVELLRTISSNVIQILVNEKATLKAHPDKVYEIVNNYILPNLDDITMAKLALGKNWRKASRAQKLRFINEFRTLLIRTYSKSLLEYKNQQINFFPLRLNGNAKIASVRAEVIQPGGPPVPLVYRVRLKNNTWKVYDIKVDGISLVTSYRGTFTQEVRKGGINGLLNYLHEKNGKLKPLQDSLTNKKEAENT